MLPRSKAWDKVYEWSNYRLACALMNTRKGTDKTVLDPCQIGDGWFELEIVACQVRPGNAVTGNELAQVQATIDSLRLNDQQCCRARDEYVTRYRDGEIELAFLERRAPFIARELRRQGLLQDGDT
jgi:hypothetical protein